MERFLRSKVVMVCRGIFIICLALAMITQSLADEEEIPPEPSGGSSVRSIGEGAVELVAAANPHAARAGAKILAAGGSAIDAAIGAQLVLNLVEPQSSGIGGGAFLLYFDSTTNSLVSYDGRETAPAAANATMFLREDGSTPGYIEALEGGQAVGVPGLLRMLELAHSASGKLSWEELFVPAIELANTGFSISPRLNSLVSKVPTLARSPSAASYFFDFNQNPKGVGKRLFNREFSQTLEIIAAGGAKAFYRGPIARDIVNAVQNAHINPGHLTLDDFTKYRAKERPPVCSKHQRFLVCGAGPPSSGGLAVLQILGLLERVGIDQLEPWSIEAVHLFLEASRLAFADRNHYVGDPDFVEVPVSGLLDPDYLDSRARLINVEHTATSVSFGVPPRLETGFGADDTSSERNSTTHISVFDRWGNVASMTSSIEFAFGSAIMVRGFLLNNQLTDFAFNPVWKGETVANSVSPAKRPRSSMSPIIVFEPGGKPVLAVGSPGGSRIICYVAKVLVEILSWEGEINTAVERGNLCNRGTASEIETGSSFVEMELGLTEMGHNVQLREMNSGLHGVMLSKDGLVGAADPRREGDIRGR